MAWNKQGFKKKKSEFDDDDDIEIVKQKGVKFDDKYAEKFLEDWEKCRSRHEGQKTVQGAFFTGEYQYIFVQAGRKFSKTTNLIDIGWWYANTHPNCVIYLGYPTIAQGIEVVWEERRLQKCDIKEDYMFDRYVAKTDDSRHILKFNNGSYIKLIGTWTEARGRGSQPDLLMFDEVQDCSPSYIEAMDSNLAAKNAPCIMSGTPSQKPGHYQEWRERIRSNPKGRVFHYTSYDNASLPHLREWLDAKKVELIKAGKEDVWLREYMAQDCFSSADRVLPDPVFEEKQQVLAKASNFAYNERIPVLAISVHGRYFCALFAVVLMKKGIFVMDKVIIPQIWCRSFAEMYPLLGEKLKELQDFCGQKLRNLVWDESGSFADVISGFTRCRKDIKWQDRGVPLLRELMLNSKIFFAQELGDFGLECQNMLMDESIKDVEKNYPHACTLAMLVNEYFQSEKKIFPEMKEFDKYAGLREMGIPCPPPKSKGKRLFSFNIGI